MCGNLHTKLWRVAAGRFGIHKMSRTIRPFFHNVLHFTMYSGGWLPCAECPTKTKVKRHSFFSKIEFQVDFATGKGARFGQPQRFFCIASPVGKRDW